MIIQTFANQAATAIQNLRLVQELEDKVRERTKKLEELNKSIIETNIKLSDQAEKLKVARDLAEAANRAKSEFLANMSHELRTPLNAVIGFSDLMVKGMTGEITDKQMEYSRYINESGMHLLNLIDEILDLSRIEAGMVELEYSDVDIKSLVDESLMFIKEKAMKHSINISVDIEEGINVIEADKRRLKQVLVNLLSNAVKFIPDSGTITVKTRLIQHSFKADNNLDYIEFSVEDTGCGIKREDIPKLFKSFVQLESPYQKRHGGTGLGLSICKQIVEAHSGKIWVESIWGKGSNFKFIIPCKQIKGHFVVDTSLSSKKIIDPVTKLLKWEHLLTHIERVISFHRRNDRQFGLLYFEIVSDDKPIDYLLFIDIFKKTIRKYEIFSQGEISGSFYIVLLDTNREAAKDVASRVEKAIKEIGYTPIIKIAIYGEDGESIEELLKALNAKEAAIK